MHKLTKWLESAFVFGCVIVTLMVIWFLVWIAMILVP